MHDAAILLWKLFDIDERKELLPNSARTVTDDLHLGNRRGGQHGFEEPEDPRHDRGNVHEKLARLKQRIRVIESSRTVQRYTHEELGIVFLK